MTKTRSKFKILTHTTIAASCVALLSAGVLFMESHAQTAPSSAITSAARAARRPLNGLPFRGDTKNGPILFRKPLPPAKVLWQTAMDQSNRMQSRRALVNSLASRLPKAQLDKTRLPVILPRDGGLIDSAKAKLMSFGDAYALNMPQPKGLQVTMYGNRSFVPTDAGAISKRPIQRLLGVVEDVRISQMEDGWTATFTRYGVVYSLDVSCDDINSPDCQSDTYIRQAITQFDDVTMGSAAQSEAGVKPKPGNWINQVTQTITKLTKGSGS